MSVGAEACAQAACLKGDVALRERRLRSGFRAGALCLSVSASLIRRAFGELAWEVGLLKEAL